MGKESDRSFFLAIVLVIGAAFVVSILPDNPVLSAQVVKPLEGEREPLIVGKDTTLTFEDNPLPWSSSASHIFHENTYEWDSQFNLWHLEGNFWIKHVTTDNKFKSEVEPNKALSCEPPCFPEPSILYKIPQGVIDKTNRPHATYIKMQNSPIHSNYELIHTQRDGNKWTKDIVFSDSSVDLLNVELLDIDSFGGLLSIFIDLTNNIVYLATPSTGQGTLCPGSQTWNCYPQSNMVVTPFFPWTQYHTVLEYTPNLKATILPGGNLYLVAYKEVGSVASITGHEINPQFQVTKTEIINKWTLDPSSAFWRRLADVNIDPRKKWPVVLIAETTYAQGTLETDQLIFARLKGQGTYCEGSNWKCDVQISSGEIGEFNLVNEDDKLIVYYTDAVQLIKLVNKQAIPVLLFGGREVSRISTAWRAPSPGREGVLADRRFIAVEEATDGIHIALGGQAENNGKELTIDHLRYVGANKGTCGAQNGYVCKTLKIDGIDRGWYGDSDFADYVDLAIRAPPPLLPNEPMPDRGSEPSIPL